jgi:hypothetical protein
MEFIQFSLNQWRKDPIEQVTVLNLVSIVQQMWFKADKPMKGYFGIKDMVCLATQDVVSQIYSQLFPQPSPKGLNNSIVDTFNGLVCRINSEIDVRRVLLACFESVT